MSRMYHMAVQWNQSCFQNLHELQKCRPIFFQDKYCLIKYHIYQKCLSWLQQAKLMKKNFKILSSIVIPTIKDIFRNFQNLNINHLHRKQKKNSKQHLNSTAMYVIFFSIIFICVNNSLGVFSKGAMGVLEPVILKNRLLAPAIFGLFNTVGKNCGC